MKLFFKKFYAIFLLIFLFSINSHIIESSVDQISIHDMFKDVSQDDLFSMMAEGQEFIQYLEKHGTEEEKMAFAQAMEETLQNFTEEDWKTLEDMTYVLEEKLQETQKASIAEEPNVTVTPVKVNPILDNSLEKILHTIHKTINTILLKVKGDKILSERIAFKWDNRDDFNEMIRLLQVINKKELITNLTTSKEESDKLLLESIENFNTRLQIENDQFIIADTFGLQADKETTADNLKKLNIIIDFFDRAIASLLPKLIKFIQSYEPLALKIAEQHEKEAKSALDHATKVEKQKRPYNPNFSSDKKHNNNQTKNSHNSHHPTTHNNSNHNQSKEHPKGYLQTVHEQNINNIHQLKKSSSKGESNISQRPQENTKETNTKETEYNKIINAIDIYLEAFSDQDFAKINTANNIFQPFGKPIDRKDMLLAEQLQQKRATNQLNPNDDKFLQKHTELYRSATDNFGKNTQKSLSIYAQMQTNIDTIIQSINEMQSVITKIKGSIDQLSTTELEQLNSSTMFKKFSNRIHAYHDQFKNIQAELRNKHKLHRLELQDQRIMNDYESLEEKINNFHGLDRNLTNLKSQLDSLHKSIKASISRSKRNENKQKVKN